MAGAGSARQAHRRLAATPTDPNVVDHRRRRRRRFQARRSASRDREPAVYLSADSRSRCRSWASWSAPTRAKRRSPTAVRAAVRSLDPELPIDEVRDASSACSSAPPASRASAPCSSARSRRPRCCWPRSGCTGSSATPSRSACPRSASGWRSARRPAQVGRLIVGQGLRLAAAGVALGLAGALAATRLLEGLLFSDQRHRPGGLCARWPRCCWSLPRWPATSRRAAPCASIR